MNNNNLSLLGSGWLGLALALSLKNNGYRVKVSTTTTSKLPILAKQGLEPHLLKLKTSPLSKKKEREWLSFLNTSVLIICLPPKRSAYVNYPKLIQNLITIIPQPHLKIVFISSTSIYRETGGEVNETSSSFSQKENGLAIKQAEDLLMHHFPNTTVLRLGGLIGNGREIEQKLVNGGEIFLDNIPVNLIHQKDAIGIVLRIIELEKWGEVFNGVAPDHPMRKNHYQKTAQSLGISGIEFKTSEKTSFKIVSSQKVVKELNYHFIYSSL